MSKMLRYETRDGKGMDIVREIPIKDFKQNAPAGTCPVCGCEYKQGVLVKDAVSSNFTDWNAFSETEPAVCPQCAQLFSVYPYSYVYTVKDGDIRLMNVRQIEEAVTRPQPVLTPFMFCISVSQKKHLFYRAVMNEACDARDIDALISVNLETETIVTTPRRQAELFEFVKVMAVIGTPKSALADGMITWATCEKLGSADTRKTFDRLHAELEMSREIQIALHAAQKPEWTEEDALKRLSRIVNTMPMDQEEQ